MRALGYPVYFLTILGVWKVLSAPALLAPRLPRLKEWAYAGIFFDLTGAAASHAFSGDRTRWRICDRLAARGPRTGAVLLSRSPRPTQKHETPPSSGGVRFAVPTMHSERRCIAVQRLVARVGFEPTTFGL
jgi:hypothetical protein